jgi:hypothetical protein
VHTSIAEVQQSYIAAIGAQQEKLQHDLDVLKSHADSVSQLIEEAESHLTDPHIGSAAQLQEFVERAASKLGELQAWNFSEPSEIPPPFRVAVESGTIEIQNFPAQIDRHRQGQIDFVYSPYARLFEEKWRLKFYVEQNVLCARLERKRPAANVAFDCRISILASERERTIVRPQSGEIGREPISFGPVNSFLTDEVFLSEGDRLTVLVEVRPVNYTEYYRLVQAQWRILNEKCARLRRAP